jgi:hypothetical protein
VSIVWLDVVKGLVSLVAAIGTVWGAGFIFGLGLWRAERVIYPTLGDDGAFHEEESR